jgi:hypothetical protein
MMKKQLLTLLLLSSFNAFSQDSLSVEKIDEIVKSYHHGRKLAGREITQDTIIFYMYDKIDTSFCVASCYKRMINYKRGSNDFIYNFHYLNDHLIYVVVFAKKRKDYTAFYFYKDRLIKKIIGETMPEIGTDEILEKSNSILAKKEIYKPKKR